jgi:hypothetical protein
MKTASLCSVWEKTKFFEQYYINSELCKSMHGILPKVVEITI